MGVRNLTGSPWHIEYLKKGESDSRRHRSRCKHFSSSSHHCSILARHCYDSSHCSYYFEKERNNGAMLKTQKANVRLQDSELNELSYGKNINEHLYVGNIIEHIKFGIGRITYIYKNSITISFPKYGEKTLSLKHCIENNLISF